MMQICMNDECHECSMHANDTDRQRSIYWRGTDVAIQPDTWQMFFNTVQITRVMVLHAFNFSGEDKHLFSLRWKNFFTGDEKSSSLGIKKILFTGDRRPSSLGIEELSSLGIEELFLS